VRHCCILVRGKPDGGKEGRTCEAKKSGVFENQEGLKPKLPIRVRALLRSLSDTALKLNDRPAATAGGDI